MWKKLLVTVIAFIATFSIGFAYYNMDMSAGGITYAGSASATARLGNAATYPDGTIGEFHEKDHIYMGIPNLDGNELTWQLVKNMNSYTQPFWISMSDDVIGTANPVINKPVGPAYNFYRNTNIKPIVQKLTDQLPSYPVENMLLVDRYIFTVGDIYQQIDGTELRFYTMGSGESGFHGIPFADLLWKQSYCGPTIFQNASNTWYTLGLKENDITIINYNDACDVRPTANWNLEDMVFAISKPNASSTALQRVDEFSNDPMKLRMLDPSMTISNVSIQNKNHDTIHQAKRDQTVIVHAETAGTPTRGTGTVSALVFKKNSSEFLFYKVLGSVSSTNEYTFDLSGIDAGEYQIALVYEGYDDSSNTPAQSSSLSAYMDLEIIDFQSLEMTYKKTYEPGPMIADSYVYQVNVLQSQKIGELEFKNGESPITFILDHDPAYSDSDGYQNFIIQGLDEKQQVPSSNTPALLDVVINPSGPDIDPVTKSLKPGAYHYCITGIDNNGDPIDAAGNPTLKSCEEMIVYPDADLITFEQLRNSDGYYSAEEINDHNYDLATIRFSQDANIKALMDADYTIQSVQLMEKGTTTEINELQAEIDTSDSTGSTYKVKKKNAVKSEDIEFDIMVTFQGSGGTKTAQINKSDQKYIIPSRLHYVDPVKKTFITADSYEFQYDPLVSANNKISMWATDSELPTTKNSRVEYCVLNETGTDCETSGMKDAVIAITSLNGMMNIELKAPGTEIQSERIRAYIKDGSGYYLTKSDITINVHPAIQKLSWGGTDIQKTGDAITKDTAKHNTWKLSLLYDRDIPANNEFDFIEQTASALVNGKVTLIDMIDPTLTPDIVYTITPSSPKDVGKVSISDGKLMISKELESNVIIKAKANAIGDYRASVEKDDPKTTDVNEDECAYLEINALTKPKVEFEFVAGYPVDGIEIHSDYAQGSMKIGTGTFSPITTIGYTLRIDEVQSVNTDGTRVDLPKDIFLLKGSSGNELFVNHDQLGASGTLPVGTYEIKIAASNSEGDEANVKVVTVKVRNAVIDATKLKWQTQENKSGASYTDVGGVIQKKIDPMVFFENSTAQMRDYKELDTYYVKLHDPDGKTIPVGATITYEVEGTTGIIDITEANRTTGLINVKSTSKNSDIVKVKATIKKDGYDNCVVYLPIKILKGSSDFKFIHKDGTDYELLHASDPTKYKSITLQYTTDASKAGIDVFTANAPAGTKVTIHIEAASDVSNGLNDVLKFKDNESTVNDDTGVKVCEITVDHERLTKCEPQIEHALNLLVDKDGKTNDYGKIMVRATFDETDEFESKTIEIPVNIEPVKPKLAFAKDEIRINSDSNGLFTPVFKALESDGMIQLLMPKEGVTSDQLWLYDEFSGPGNPAFYKGIDSYGYHMIVNEGDPELKFTIRAQQRSSRDYTKSDEVTASVVVSAKEQYEFTTTVKSYELDGGPSKRSITYGDAYFQLIPDNPDDDGLEVSYSFTIDDEYQEYARAKALDSENDKFIPLKVGDQIPIHIVRTVKDQLPQEGTSYISIKPREIKLQVRNISKKVGLSVQTSEYQLSAESEWNRILPQDADVIGDLKFSCLNHNGKDVSTMTSGVTLAEDQNIIHAAFPTEASVTDVLKNYKILHMDGRTEGIQSGILSVREDMSDSTWYEVKPGIKDDGTTAQLKNGWYNGDAEIHIVPSESGEYDLISDDVTKPFDPVKFKVQGEGRQDVHIYFKKSGGDEKNAISSSQKETILIDRTAPKINKITANDSNNKLQDLLHLISFGILFKPGTEFEVTTSDALEALEVSGTDHLLYQIYRVESDGSETELTDGVKKAVVTSEEASIQINDRSGKYKICVIAVDLAGNESTKTCHEVQLGYENVNETTGEGECPDINLDMNDDGIADLNIDRDGDHIPDLNIDADHDGKPDINVDSDKDGKPDINLVKLTRWKPGMCMVTKEFVYATQQDISPEINVVIDDGVKDIEDQIPMLNIDNNGDFKPDLNITHDKNGTAPYGEYKPYMNIVVLHEWKPMDDYVSGALSFDSIGTAAHDPKPYLNIDTDGDGRPDINLDLNHDGKPEINIDWTGDQIPDTQIDTTGDGKPDTNLDVDGNGIADENIIEISKWKPDRDVDEPIAYDTMFIERRNELEDNGVVIEKPDGAFLPNFAIKVNDVTSTEKETISHEAEALIKDQEVKAVYDVKLLKNDVETQPDGVLKVRLPIPEGIQNPKVLIKKSNGAYEQVAAREENGYLVYETTELGTVSVIGDSVDVPKEPVEPDIPNQGDNQKKPNTDVPGSYITGTPNDLNAIGGASTGDHTDQISLIWMMMVGLSGGLAVLLLFLQKKKHSDIQ